MQSTAEQIEQDLLRPLFHSSGKYWVAVALATSLLLAGVAAFGYQLYAGHRRVGPQLPGVLGLRHHQLRLLDRHQPRGHADLRDSASHQCHLAPPGHSLRRGHHRLLRSDRRHHSALPHRPPVARFLDDPLSQRTPYLAQLPLAARLGLLRHLHLPHRQHHLPVSADDSGFRRRARRRHRLAQEDLSRPGAGMAGHAAAMAAPGNRHAHHGHGDRSRSRLGAHHRLLGFRHDPGAHVALQHLRPLLCRRRDLQRHRRPDPGHGAAAQVPALGGISPAHPLSKISASCC